MDTQSALMSWLLDPAEPGVRYLALRDLLHLPEDDPELAQARCLAHTQGPIAAVLEQMAPEGYWSEPGPGYNPKYFSSVWALVLLAQLGGSINEDPRIAHGCQYLLEHGLASGGQFSATGAPSGTADCLQGNLVWALLALGCSDPRLEQAIEWMARTVTGEGISPIADRKAPVRYYAGKCGPRFACGANNRMPCAWGAAKVMLAFGKLPPERRTALVEDAIRVGTDFLLGTDPAAADYPHGYAEKPSGNWWKFGFPVFYITDILQIAEALVSLGLREDARLANTLALVRQKAGTEGRWALEYDYTGKTLVDFGPKKQANKWVTLRAVRVLGSI